MCNNLPQNQPPSPYLHNIIYECSLVCLQARLFFHQKFKSQPPFLTKPPFLVLEPYLNPLSFIQHIYCLSNYSNDNFGVGIFKLLLFDLSKANLNSNKKLDYLQSYLIVLIFYDFAHLQIRTDIEFQQDLLNTYFKTERQDFLLSTRFK